MLQVLQVLLEANRKHKLKLLDAYMYVAGVAGASGSQPEAQAEATRRHQQAASDCAHARS
jgi:hypothetical protein